MRLKEQKQMAEEQFKREICKMDLTQYAQFNLEQDTRNYSHSKLKKDMTMYLSWVTVGMATFLAASFFYAIFVAGPITFAQAQRNLNESRIEIILGNRLE